MTEEDLKVFVDVTMNYFDKISGDQARMAEPYISFEPPPLLDYTGMIEIAGKGEGIFYITTEPAMLHDLLLRIGESDTSEETLLDYVGEIATTLSGNVRKQFGGSFRISVPVTVGGSKKEHPDLPFANFVVPIQWKDFNPFMVIGMTADEDGDE